MTPWRLELLRMTRSPRALIMILVYALLGLAGPVMAKFMPKFAEHAAGGIKIIVPPPTPADGIADFVNQAAQTGLIVTIAIAAGAVSFYGRQGLAVFYRTRVSSGFAILWPRFVAMCLVAVLAYLIGSLSAWYGTVVVLGGLPTARVLLGVASGALFLVFTVAVVTAAAAYVRRTLTTVGVAAIVLLLILPIMQATPVVRPWVPTTLLTAPATLLTESGSDAPVRAMATAGLASVALLALAVYRVTRREI